MEEKKNYFTELNKINCETSEKNKLTYISWSDAWTEVKKMYPESTYTIYENEEWFPFWESKFGIDCKVWVTIQWIEHIVRLPVMNGANKAMKAESYTYQTNYWEKTVEAATQFDINKTTQRAFAKAIAMHGIWLYVFRWEDLPEDMEWEVKKTTTQTAETKPKYFNYEDLVAVVEAWNNTLEEILKVIREDWFTVSANAKKAIAEYVNTWEINKDTFFGK